MVLTVASPGFDERSAPCKHGSGRQESFDNIPLCQPWEWGGSSQLDYEDCGPRKPFFLIEGNVNFRFKHSVKPQEWYNPRPESIGRVVAELCTRSGIHKSLVIQKADNSFCIYLYKRDDSDIEAKRSSAVGWIGEVGPSFADSIERAKELAAEYLPPDTEASAS